jgi:hypothetical protein
VPQPGRQYLLQLGQGADGRLRHPGDGAARRDAQADRDGDGLLVVQQQRGQFGAGAEPVTAGGPGAGVHRVAEITQLVHVAAQRPRADLQPSGQFGARPVPPRLQQREQAEQPRRRLQHGADSGTDCGQHLTAMAFKVHI